MGGRWINRKEGWLHKEKVKETYEPVNNDDYGVLYIPVRCPKCNSKKVFCYASRLPVRYHRCKNCGASFKSVEQ